MYKTKEEVRSPNKETKQSVFVRDVRPIIKSTYPMLLKPLVLTSQKAHTAVLVSYAQQKKQAAHTASAALIEDLNQPVFLVC